MLAEAPMVYKCSVFPAQTTNIVIFNHFLLYSSRTCCLKSFFLTCCLGCCVHGPLVINITFLLWPTQHFCLIACYSFPHSLPCLKCQTYFFTSYLSFPFGSLLLSSAISFSLPLHSTVRFSFRLFDPHSPLFSPPFSVSFLLVPLPMDFFLNVSFTPWVYHQSIP